VVLVSGLQYVTNQTTHRTPEPWRCVVALRWRLAASAVASSKRLLPSIAASTPQSTDRSNLRSWAEPARAVLAAAAKHRAALSYWA
jgi:hypothetical protein